MTAATEVKKIAISKEGYFNIFDQLDPKIPLTTFVKEICKKWTLSNPEQYSLQYLYSKIYITEENRAEIKDGDVFTLAFNVELAAAKYLSDIEQPDLSIKRTALVHFAGMDGAGQADDPLFAKEFINRNGISTLVKIIDNPSEPSDVIAQAIVAVQELMEHGFVPWDPTVNQEFVLKILSYANKTDGTDRKIVQRSIAMLDSIVTYSSALFVTLVMNRMKLENLVQHIKRDDPKLKLSAISLCNSIFMKMEQNNRLKFAKSLSSKGYTEVLQKIIAGSHSTPISSELSHQLYIYQSLLLSLFEPRMNSKPDINDVELIGTMQNLYDVAFESTAYKEKNISEKPDFKKLGFANSAPLVDFQECPPGMLAYDVITFFAKKHQDQYIKIIMENSVRDKEYECPFGRCSQQLVKILCELLNVGAPISDTGNDIQPMFFTSGDIFEELYSVTIQLLNKTWKEMRATTSDISRVLGVVKDQIKRVLNERPDSIDKFKTKAFSLTYQQVLRLMQQEAQERTILDSQSKPVMELREHIEPEIQELVRQQRLAQLVEGQFFAQYSARGRPKDRYRFCCLSPNYRFLHYGDASNESTPSIESLSSKISLSEVDGLLLGKDAPHSKNLKSGDRQLAFSIMYNQKEHLDFVAPSQQVFSVWSDALLKLTGKEMTSKEFHDDMDMLLNMEMKLLLLDLEDVRIPEVPPPIPQQPDNYNFYYRDE